jgi:dihydrodipicolinate synthase/N-acetylneuraminate lyase
MTIEQFTTAIRPRRKVRGIAAALLPYDGNGRIAADAFQQHLTRTRDAGLVNAVNMDTGYVNYLTDSEKRQVLQWSKEALGPNTPFVAGAYIEGKDGDLVTLYRRAIDEIVSFGGTPILFQTTLAHGLASNEKVHLYQHICKGYEQVIGFELGKMFAPNGEIFDEDTFRGLLDIPQLKGIKHSSLDRTIELSRLRLRDESRPDFRIYTGNDLGINMIEYGSDYLLGLATFAPERFALRDQLWEQGDAEYYAISDALQLLGNVAFRPPVPAYKHSAAVFLHLTGCIPSPQPHPRNPTRPAWEPDILRDVALRLGLDVAFKP